MKLELFTSIILLILLLSKIYVTVRSIKLVNKYPVGDMHAKKMAKIVGAVLFSIAFLYLMFARSKNPRSTTYIITTVILFLSSIFMALVASEMAYFLDIVKSAHLQIPNKEYNIVIAETVIIFVIAISAFTCGIYRSKR